MDAWEELVADLPELAVDAALEVCHDLEVATDEVVMEAGAYDPALVYLVSGEVEVRRGGVQLAVCGVGQILGEMGMFRDVPRMAEVVTRRPTRALVLTRAGYAALVDANNPVVYQLERRMLHQLEQRLHRMDGLVSARAVGEEDPFRRPPKAFFAQLQDLLLGEIEPDILTRRVDPVRVVERSHLFRGERYALLQGLAELLEPRVFPAGEVICGQGQPGGPIHLVAEGTARVVAHVAPGRIHQLGTVGPGACVGMTSLVDGRPRMASVVALEQVDVLSLRKDRYVALVGRDGQIPSALRRAMIRAFADQLESAGAALVAIASGDLPGAVSAVATEIYDTPSSPRSDPDPTVA